MKWLLLDFISIQQATVPQGFVDKPFLWTDGRVSLKAALNKTAYGHDENVAVTVNVHNNSRKVVRKIRVRICLSI